MIITKQIEVTSCNDCPEHEYVDHENYRAYKCNKGIKVPPFKTPRVPPYGCPYFDFGVMERVSSNLEIPLKDLEFALKEEHCKLVDL